MDPDERRPTEPGRRESDPLTELCHRTDAVITSDTCRSPDDHAEGRPDPHVNKFLHRHDQLLDRSICRQQNAILLKTGNLDYQWTSHWTRQFLLLDRL